MTFMANCEEMSDIVDIYHELDLSILKSDIPSSRPDTSPLVDSGASRTVCGETWASQWTGSMDFKDWPSPSSMNFKFGIGQSFPSLGEIILAG